MKPIRSPLYFFFLTMFLLLSACAAPVATQPALSGPSATQPVSAQPTSVPATLAPTATMATATEPATLPPPTLTVAPTTPSDLTVDKLKNFTFTSPMYGKTIQLTQGKYEAGNGVDYLRASLLESIAFGDLNHDGKPDAAILLAENGGGSGTFISLIAMLDQDGAPHQGSAIMVGDRPRINSLKIQDGKIVLEGVIHSKQAPLCCPDLPVIETYTLSKSGLILQRLESITPNGMQRGIAITSPKTGDVVSGSFPLQGNVTIAPFENNLVYRIFDGQGNKLAEGPVTVNAANPGDAGTFDTTIDLTNIPAGLLVRLELQDLSAADGSTLAMDSVELMIK